MYNDTKLARSVQRDYLRDAQVARLIAQNSSNVPRTRALLIMGTILGFGSVLAAMLG